MGVARPAEAGRGGGSTGQGTPAADLLWQVPSDSGSGRDLPSAPLMLEDRILVALESLMAQALDPRTGRFLWSDEDVFLFHQMTTDGKRVYAVGYSLEDDAPYVVRAVDPATGKAGATVARLTDLRGRLFESQLLCATDTVLLGVGGAGRPSTDGFRKDQSWFLFALDPGPATGCGPERSRRGRTARNGSTSCPAGSRGTTWSWSGRRRTAG